MIRKGKIASSGNRRSWTWLFLFHARHSACLAEVWISVPRLQNCWPLWEMFKSFDVTYCWANSISGTKNILGLYLFPSIVRQWHYHCSSITDISQLRLLERAEGWREYILKCPKDFVAPPPPPPFAYRGHKLTHGTRHLAIRKQLKAALAGLPPVLGKHYTLWGGCYQKNYASFIHSFIHQMLNVC